jgi:hypothetical protein
LDAGEANPVGRRTSAISPEPSSAGACDQLGPQILNELAHRVRDGFDALEVENAFMDAFDIVRLNNPAIEDARLIAGFFLVIAADRGVAIDLPASNKEACPRRREGHCVKSDR